MTRKKVLYALAVVACVVAAMAAMPMAARAEAVTSTGTWGGATYTVYDDGTATVTGKFTSASPGPAPDALQSCKSIDVSGVDTSSVTSTYLMFQYCTGPTSIDGLASWDMSHVTDMSYMFYDCSNLTDLDAIGGWDVSHVQYMEAVFSGCTSLRSVSLFGWDVSGLVMFGNAHNIYVVDLFFECQNLKSVWLGPGITSEYRAIVRELEGVGLNSTWYLEDGSKGPYTPSELANAWQQHPMPGHWVTSVSYRVSLDPNGGIGSMTSLTASPNVTAPASRFLRPGYRFTGWNAMADGSGASYAVGATLTPTADMTLYAQWKQMPTTAKYSDGMNITLHAGEQVTIEGLPAGASYEVTEMPVPSGWTLVRQQNTRGIILPSRQ